MSAAALVLVLLLPPLPPLGFFGVRCSRISTGAGAASRAATAMGCATEASGCAAGAGDARARVAKKRVVAAANFMVCSPVSWGLCGESGVW